MPLIMSYILHIFACNIYSDFDFDQSFSVNIGTFEQVFIALFFDTIDTQDAQDVPVLTY